MSLNAGHKETFGEAKLLVFLYLTTAFEAIGGSLGRLRVLTAGLLALIISRGELFVCGRRLAGVSCMTPSTQKLRRAFLSLYLSIDFSSSISERRVLIFFLSRRSNR